MMGSSPRRSSSPHSNAGSNLEAWGDGEYDSATPHVPYGPTKPSVIEEIEEPGTPQHEGQPYRSPGTSVLADMLRRASLAASPPDDEIDSGGGDTAEDTGDEEALISGQGKNSTPGGADATEHTPLLRQVSQGQSQRPNYLSGGHDLEAQPIRRIKSWPKVNKILSKQLRRGRRAARLVSSPEKWDKKVIWQRSVVEPAGYIPAVVLGALLNVLDALSYGMILFPLGEPLFEKLGPAGISMFYVSCIVSQLVFSFGGSIFKGGVGSEMIEVVPFFHKMAFTILATVGEDNPKAVISTTITSYAISSILTGLVFFLMGICRFGYIVGFIPRHILIGCIGGVGWFLIATGLEVTARLEGNLEYNWKTLHKLIQFDTVFQWVTPLVLGLFLYRSSKIFTGKYYLPTFILLIPAIFYFFVFALPQLDISQLREDGWIFDAPDADEPWWYFYTLYGMLHLQDSP
jgi:SulP family sulfate permease